MVLPLRPSGERVTNRTPGCEQPGSSLSLTRISQAPIAPENSTRSCGQSLPNGKQRTCAMLNILFSRRSLQAALAAGLLVVAAASGAVAQTRDRVVVASKIDTEGALLGHVIA